jgi:hypothetical protein
MCCYELQVCRWMITFTSMISCGPIMDPQKADLLEPHRISVREAIMPKTDHREPINFVGMYFIDEHGEDYRTGQIIARISDGYYLAEFDGTDDNVPPAPLEVLSAADFNKACDNCGSRHWQFFRDVKTRQRWITWLTTPDPAKDKMGKVVHLKPKPDQPA